MSKIEIDREALKKSVQKAREVLVELEVTLHSLDNSMSDVEDLVTEASTTMNPVEILGARLNYLEVGGYGDREGPDYKVSDQYDYEQGYKAGFRDAVRTLEGK